MFYLKKNKVYVILFTQAYTQDKRGAECFSCGKPIAKGVTYYQGLHLPQYKEPFIINDIVPVCLKCSGKRKEV